MGESKRRGRRSGLVAIGLGALALAGTVHAGERSGSTSRGRGWVWGATIGGGVESYRDAEDLALAVGPEISQQVAAYGGSVVTTRDAVVVRAGDVPPGGTVAVVPFPQKEAQVSFSFHGGYAFSRKLALLVDVQMGGGFSDASFDQIVGGYALRYSPVPRLWVQAGPGTGLLWGHYDQAKTPDMSSRVGLLAAAGLVLAQKKTWALDLQVRYARLPHDGFTTSRLHVAIGAGKRRS
jgi:hypothetical protein